ncbi:DUF4157 domain-containing protein [Halogeometricum borinquense]|uniref:DUF4157 domain-containing protein n=1 Tax=Halogeometricum borinquense TaxID=60847 RepID=A0A6C0UMB0_9EURY|nr:DUF4157 domain-containing protein [Halogeometricum borinquense]QIB75713.1 DUF4157 domain-containing protein [Halogeometricum borinquense]
MGFRSTEERAREGDRSSSVPSIQELTGGSNRNQSRGGGDPLTPQECESRFGVEIYMDGLDTKIQRLAKKHGAGQVREWADEGMTVDTMGKPRDMRAFRERQKQRPAEVPKDIERRNAKSVQRSRGAHHEASKAGDANVPDSVRDVISSPGQQLDTSIQRAMEDRIGDTLGDVRIHTGPSAAKACEDINARAFTVGNHIAFNHGEYDPSSAEGQHVLAHELAHVRQQTGGAVSMLPQEGELEIDPDPRLEREAEETAQRVMQGGKIGVHRMEHSDVHVQRMPRWNNLPDRDTVASPLVALKEMGLSDELLAELEQTVDDDKYDEFFEDLWRIGDSPKDLGKDLGDVGEVLSSHPEKNLVEGFVENFDERDELVTVPAHDNTVKGLKVNSSKSPEFDKLIMNKETGEILRVIEEKTGNGNEAYAKSAISQAKDNLESIQIDGVPQDKNGTAQISNVNRLNTYVQELTKSDFENAVACAIVPAGMDDSDKDRDANRVRNYKWNPDQLKLMYKIARDVRPW